MQAVPSIVYYTTYYKRKSQFLMTQTTTANETQDIDYLADDAASDLNRTLTARSNSRV
jgi:hypothetical protein